MDHQDILSSIFNYVNDPLVIANLKCASLYYKLLLTHRDFPEYIKLQAVVQRFFENSKYAVKFTFHSEHYPFKVLSFSTNLYMQVGYKTTSFDRTCNRHWKIFEKEIKHISDAGIDEITIWIHANNKRHISPNGKIFKKLLKQIESALTNPYIPIYIFKDTNAPTIIKD